MISELTGSLIGVGSRFWVVGKVTNVLSDGWDFIGVFSDESLALGSIDVACKNPDDKGCYFVAPTNLNEPHLCPDGSDWQGGYFPY